MADVIDLFPKPVKKKSDGHKKNYDKLRAEGKIGLDMMTPEKRKEIQLKGMEASHKAQRKKKLIRESLQDVLSLRITDTELIDKLRDLGIVDEDMTNQALMALSVVKRVIETGDPYAAAFVRDTLGQKEADKFEVNQNTSDVIWEIKQYVEQKTIGDIRFDTEQPGTDS